MSLVTIWVRRRWFKMQMTSPGDPTLSPMGCPGHCHGKWSRTFNYCSCFLPRNYLTIDSAFSLSHLSHLISRLQTVDPSWPVLTRLQDISWLCFQHLPWLLRLLQDLSVPMQTQLGLTKFGSFKEAVSEVIQSLYWPQLRFARNQI